MSLRLPSAGTTIRATIGLAIVAAILFFLVRHLASNWGELSDEDVNVQPALLVVSALPAIVAVLILAVGWTRIVNQLETRARLPAGQLERVFLYSWLGRYLPGKVGYLLGRFYLGRLLGGSSTALLVSMAYEGLLLLAAGAAFATVTLVPALAVESETVWPYLALPALAVAGVAAMHPRVLGWGLGFSMRLLGREYAQEGWLLRPEELLKLGAIYLAAILLNGVGFYLLIISLTDYSVGHMPLAMGAFALAGALGMVSVFAPAGIGVREGIVAAILQTTMPVELAILISLVARLWATAIDVVVVAGGVVYDAFCSDRLFVRVLRGRGEGADAQDAASASLTPAGGAAPAHERGPNPP